MLLILRIENPQFSDVFMTDLTFGSWNLVGNIVLRYVLCTICLNPNVHMYLPTFVVINRTLLVYGIFSPQSHTLQMSPKYICTTPPPVSEHPNTTRYPFICRPNLSVE